MTRLPRMFDSNKYIAEGSVDPDQRLISGLTCILKIDYKLLKIKKIIAFTEGLSYHGTEQAIGAKMDQEMPELGISWQTTVD